MKLRGRSIVIALIVTVLCVLAAGVWCVALFPEYVISWVVAWYLDGGQCKMAAVQWRETGADVRGISLNSARIRADVELLQLRAPRLSDGRRLISLAVTTGQVEWIVEKKAQAEERRESLGALEERLPRWPVEVTLQRVCTRLRLPHTTNVLTLIWAGQARCDRLAATQATVHAKVTMENPPGGQLTAWGTWSSNQVWLQCEPAVSSVNYVVRYLPVRLPVKVTKGKIFGVISCEADLGGATASVRAATARLSFSSERLSVPEQKVSVHGIAGGMTARLVRPVWTSDQPRDWLTYVLARVEGTCTAQATGVALDSLWASNITIVASLATSWVEIAQARFESMGGVVETRGRVRRVKVKEKLEWRWLYDVECSVTNAEAGQVCTLMNLTTNRLEGRFSGRVRLAGFGPRVSHFSGDLLSGGGGVFYFPDAATYLMPQKKSGSLQDKLIEINIERLRKYDYRQTELVLSFDPTSMTTVMRFNFAGRTQGDTVKFELHHHGTWLDAFNLGKMLRGQ